MRHHKSRRHHRHRGSRKNFINKSLDNSVQLVKSTSKKYMPKLKTGLESVGSKVVKTSQESVPYLQRLTRKAFGLLRPNKKTRHNRKH
jgi:hypothetical protein